MSDEAARRFDLAVIGLGYVGLPLVIEAHKSGLTVLGVEVDSRKVQRLLEGSSYIEDVSDEELRSAIADGFLPTVDNSQLAQADTSIICVPTPLKDQVPDLTAVTEAGKAVGEHLERGQLVILQSTSYPGTTQDMLQPLLEQHSGLKAGEDFFLAFAPERIDPGNPQWNLRNTPKLVAGIDGRSTERAAELFGKICDDIVTLSGPREAEMAKLLENTYRHVNIALINEMAIFCRELGIDVWEVIRGASTKPFGFEAFYPGPRCRRPLHPGGPQLPLISGRTTRLPVPFRRIGQRDQCSHADLRGQPNRRASQPTQQTGQGLARGASWSFLQTGYERHKRNTGPSHCSQATRLGSNVVLLGFARR